jgi:ACS family hexuronate transporter-like MFS transporter
VGGAVAPFIILPIYLHWGWRVAFVIPGLLGFLWLIVWRKMYYRPQEHPRITAEERQMLLTDIEAESVDKGEPGTRRLPGWGELLKLPQTWGTLVSKGLTDPVWFFVTDWFPIFLVAKGIALKNGLVAVWIPFLAADLGNFFGGWISGVLIKRGWSVGAARKSMVVFGGFGVMLLIPTIFTTKLWLITLLFAIATFAYASFSTIANVLPTDLFKSDSVATVSGLSGTGAGIGTIVAFELIGHFSDLRRASATHAFDPIMIAAGVIPFVGMILVLLLVRNTRATEKGLVRRI